MDNSVQNVDVESVVPETKGAELIEGPKSEPQKELTPEEMKKEITTLNQKVQMSVYILSRLFNKIDYTGIVTKLDEEAEDLAKMFGTSFNNKVVRRPPESKKKKE